VKFTIDTRTSSPVYADQSANARYALLGEVKWQQSAPAFRINAGWRQEPQRGFDLVR